MYRIKFERDLKELEQFGYKKDAQGNYSKKVMKDTNKGWTYFETIEINKDDRIVRTRLYQDCADQEWVGYIEKKGRFIYDLDEAIVEKINKIAMKIYGAKAVLYPEEVARKIEKIEEMGYGKLPICIAKTQYSFSDDAKNLECEEPFEIHVKDVELKAGAGFIVVLAGNIMTMPGLPVVPAAENIDIDEAGNIVGLF